MSVSHFSTLNLVPLDRKLSPRRGKGSRGGPVTLIGFETLGDVYYPKSSIKDPKRNLKQSGVWRVLGRTLNRRANLGRIAGFRYVRKLCLGQKI